MKDGKIVPQISGMTMATSLRNTGAQMAGSGGGLLKGSKIQKAQEAHLTREARERYEYETWMAYMKPLFRQKYGIPFYFGDGHTGSVMEWLKKKHRYTTEDIEEYNRAMSVHYNDRERMVEHQRLSLVRYCSVTSSSGKYAKLIEDRIKKLRKLVEMGEL